MDNPEHRYPFAHETITTGIREATITGKPYPDQRWLVYATNLIHALPNEQETIKAIQNLDLMVVIDVIPSEIAGWADVVLPESVYLERHDDLNVEWFREPFIALRQPVVDAPHEQKPNWWIARELARETRPGRLFSLGGHIEEYFRHRLAAAGLSYEELKTNGILRGTKQPIYFEEGVRPKFPTPSGKIEFTSLQLAAAGFDPVPSTGGPPEALPAIYRLLYGRAPVHSFSRTQSNRILSDMMPRERSLGHPRHRARHELEQRTSTSALKNQDGVVSNPGQGAHTERIRPDCVYMVHGFGHTARGLTHATGKVRATHS